jgi:hypothetical protein
MHTPSIKGDSYSRIATGAYSAPRYMLHVRLTQRARVRMSSTELANAHYHKTRRPSRMSLDWELGSRLSALRHQRGLEIDVFRQPFPGFASTPPSSARAGNGPAAPTTAAAGPTPRLPRRLPVGLTPRRRRRPCSRPQLAKLPGRASARGQT